MRKNIVLTGIMGTGKSSVGKTLADRLNFKFVDTDNIIETNEGKKINDIFKINGEEYFRKLENRVCKNLSIQNGLVISTGGGIVLNPENISLLKKNGIIINLTASPEILWQRLKNKTNRPLLKNDNPLETLKKLLNDRKKFYTNADFFINTDSLNIEEVAEKILNIIKQEFYNEI